MPGCRAAFTFARSVIFSPAASRALSARACLRESWNANVFRGE